MKLIFIFTDLSRNKLTTFGVVAGENFCFFLHNKSAMVTDYVVVCTLQVKRYTIPIDQLARLSNYLPSPTRYPPLSVGK